MDDAATKVAILTYHSISEASGPTSTPPAVFRMQMETLAASGAKVISVDEFRGWMLDGERLTGRPVVITFDDAFADFAEASFPVLKRFGFPSFVFAPTRFIGAKETWRGAGEPARALMDWTQICALAREGVTFGAHAATHPDLTTLSDEELDQELSESGNALCERLGVRPRYFAPPYGSSDARVRDAIAKYFDLSFGVQLAEAGVGAPRYDIPRVEMHYFRNETLWRRFLDGRGGLYFGARKLALRARTALIRSLASNARN